MACYTKFASDRTPRALFNRLEAVLQALSIQFSTQEDKYKVGETRLSALSSCRRNPVLDLWERTLAVDLLVIASVAHPCCVCSRSQIRARALTNSGTVVFTAQVE